MECKEDRVQEHKHVLEHDHDHDHEHEHERGHMCESDHESDHDHERDERFEHDNCINKPIIALPVTDARQWINAAPVEINVCDIPIDKMKVIFPKCTRYHDLRMTDVGLYSITRREEAYFITDLIVKYYYRFQEHRFTITDSTSGIGGNGITFLLHPCIEHVNFIELNPLHVEILRHNINIYKFGQKASIHEGNFLDIGPKLQQDVIFHDFPWGGVNYRDASQLRLGLQHGTKWVFIEDIVNECRLRTKLQVLKVPINFAFSYFFCHVDFCKIKLHKIYNRFTKSLYYYLILLFS